MAKLFKSLALLVFVQSLLGCTSASQQIERKNYNAWENDVGYTQVVKVNNMLHISGVTSAEATFDRQIDAIYTSIKKILSDYNVDTNAIVKEVIFTTDIEALKAHISIRKAHFNNGYPASSWIEVKRLWNPSNLLEVEVVVVLP
jgi:2-iminobutanoate/2-iminopropanoate deaminase